MNRKKTIRQRYCFN